MNVMSMWTVYRFGTDGYDGYTARLWRVTAAGAQPTDSIIRTPDLERIRDIMRAGDRVYLHRSDDDPAEVMETWL